MSYLRYLYGRYQLWAGYCPKCESSPPDPDCYVCAGEREYGPQISEANKKTWRLLWETLR